MNCFLYSPPCAMTLSRRIKKKLVVPLYKGGVHPQMWCDFTDFHLEPAHFEMILQLLSSGSSYAVPPSLFRAESMLHIPAPWAEMNKKTKQ